MTSVLSCLDEVEHAELRATLSGFCADMLERKFNNTQQQQTTVPPTRQQFTSLHNYPNYTPPSSYSHPVMKDYCLERSLSSYTLPYHMYPNATVRLR